MTLLPPLHFLRAWTVLLLGGGILVGALYSAGATLVPQLSLHRLTVVVFVVAITVGETFALRMPSGRVATPLATASALALAFLGRIDGEPTFDVTAGFVVLVCGDVMTMPGLPVTPAASRIDLLDDGTIVGLS